MPTTTTNATTPLCTVRPRLVQQPVFLYSTAKVHPLLPSSGNRWLRICRSRRASGNIHVLNGACVPGRIYIYSTRMHETAANFAVNRTARSCNNDTSPTVAHPTVPYCRALHCAGKSSIASRGERGGVQSRQYWHAPARANATWEMLGDIYRGNKVDFAGSYPQA